MSENRWLVYKNYASLGSQSFVLNLPSSLNPFGIYRLRISMQFNQYRLNPCAIFSYEEVEDYVFVALDPFGIADFSDGIASSRDYSAVEKIPKSTKPSISPNPVSNFIQINTFEDRDILKNYRIISGSRKLMQNFYQYNSIGNRKIDISNFPNGYCK